MLEHQGRVQTIAQWARDLGIRTEVMWYRVARGCPPETLFHRGPIPPGKRYKAQKIEYEGRALTVAEWAKEFNIKPNTIYERLAKKWPLERVFGPRGRRPRPKSSNPNRGHQVTWNGKTQNLKAWAIELGIKPVTMHRRHMLGWTVDEMLGIKTLKVGRTRLKRKWLSKERWEALLRSRRKGPI